MTCDEQDAELTNSLGLEPLIVSPLTLWKGCENVSSGGHSQY
jgi:hypothetical protein